MAIAPKIVTVVRDWQMYNRCIANNCNLSGCVLCPIDNTVKNERITTCYNRFLRELDYSTSGWIVFCHEDWEPKEDLAKRIEKLDKNSLWGPIGAVTRRRFLVWGQWRLVGQIEECLKNGDGLSLAGSLADEGEKVDTLDCCCCIVHSSLLNRLNFRFDEQLSFDLYIEDFCISANVSNSVASKILPVKCCHWSKGSVLPRYYRQEEYVNSKWRALGAGAYTGTISPFLGGHAPWWLRFTLLVKKVRMWIRHH